MRYPKLMASLFLLMALFLLGCSVNQAPPTPTPTTVTTTSTELEGEPVQVAVLAIRSAVAANKQYGPILTYLQEQLGRPFKLVPVGQEDQFTVVEEGQVDFTFNNPLSAVQLQRLYKTQFLATLSRNKTGPEFSALIIAKNGSDITTVEDLRDKTAACVAFETAAAGCVFQIYHLSEHGIDPFTDFASFTENQSQDNIVLSVLNGTIDVGFIRTGQLEKMLAEEKITSLEELQIIDQAEDDFFYPHTTRLYPEWPFAALEGTDPELVEAVKEALLNISPDHPAMLNAKATEFVAEVDYSPLNELIERLQLKSWDATGF